MAMTAAEYQAAALASLTQAAPASTTEVPTPPAVTAESGATGEEPKSSPPAPSSGDADVDAAEKALAAKAKAKAAGAVPAEETPPADDEAPPADLKPGFNALTREKAALRKREQELAAREAKFGPALKAVESGDYVSAVRALGITHEQYVKSLLDGKAAPKAAAPEENPVAKEVSELKQMILQEREEKRLVQMTARAAQLIPASKLKLAANAKIAEAFGVNPAEVAVQYVENYKRETGEYPAATADEALRIGLQAVEAHFETQVKTARAILTALGEGGTVLAVPKNAAPQSATSEQAPQSRTLSNSSVAPAKPGSDTDEPRTPEEYQRRALALMTAGA